MLADTRLKTPSSACGRRRRPPRAVARHCRADRAARADRTPPVAHRAIRACRRCVPRGRFHRLSGESLGLVRIVVSSYQDVIKVIGWTPPQPVRKQPWRLRSRRTSPPRRPTSTSRSFPRLGCRPTSSPGRFGPNRRTSIPKRRRFGRPVRRSRCLRIDAPAGARSTF